MFSRLVNKNQLQGILKITRGLSIRKIYPIALKYGYSKPYRQFLSAYNQTAKYIYKNAVLTPGLNQMIKKLTQNNFRLGLVSASPRKWINYVLNRLPNPAVFNTVISTIDSRLPAKPAPDAYLTAMKYLKTQPQQTIILEDSRYGIQAAKASGAHTICLTQFWPKHYSAPGADRYVNSLKEVDGIINKFL